MQDLKQQQVDYIESLLIPYFNEQLIKSLNFKHKKASQLRGFNFFICSVLLKEQRHALQDQI